MLSRVVFQLSGMHCSSCAMNVDFELEDLDGVKEAKTHYGKQKSEVTFYSDKVTHEQMVQVISKLGYQVTEINEI